MSLHVLFLQKPFAPNLESFNTSGCGEPSATTALAYRLAFAAGKLPHNTSRINIVANLLCEEPCPLDVDVCVSGKGEAKLWLDVPRVFNASSSLRIRCHFPPYCLAVASAERFIAAKWRVDDRT